MIYEIYLDSILVEVFLWDYCVLKLTNAGFCRASGGWRIFVGAIAGTLGYTLPLLLPLPPLGKGILEVGSCGGMLWFTFPVKSFHSFLRVLGSYLKYALLLGGSVLLTLRLPGIESQMWRELFSLLILGFLTAGGLFLQRKNGANGRKIMGRAVLIRNEKRLSVDALVDSGNSLVEPISGKPVCVLDQDAARALWGDAVLKEDPTAEEDISFRMIPYRSVGQKKGIMKGYLLSEMQLELGGPIMTFHNVYMAVSPQELTKEEGKTQVLIHPALAAQDRKKNQAEKEREGLKE